MYTMLDFSFGGNLIDILIFSVGCLSILGIIAVVVLFFVSNHSQKKYAQEVNDSSNTLRVFVMDVANDKVDYFNSSYLTKRKTCSVTYFYNQFKTNDREKLITWIGELLENKEEVQRFLEIHVYIKAKKMSVPSLLQVTKIDHKRQLIYLESHLLKYNDRDRHKGLHHTFTSKEILSRRILQSSGKGCTFCVNFYNKATKTNDFSRLAYIGIKNILCSFSCENIVVTEHEFGKIIIANLYSLTKLNQFSFLDQIRSKINSFLLIESLADEIDYTVGVIENQVNFRDANTLMKNVVSLSEHAIDSTQQVMFYSDKEMNKVEDQGQQFRTDVETIVQDNKLAYYFQVIYDFGRNKVIGYQSSSLPLDSYFKNIDDLKNYAMRTEDDKELFSTIVKNTISRFVQEKNDDNVSLFLPISYNEINFVNRSLGHTQGVSDSHIVLELKEKELGNITGDYGEEGFINTIRSFKSKGYAVALEIDDNVLTLSPRIYDLFDYFNLSVASHISKKNAGDQLPTFQGLIEKLLHYQKPIVATNIPSWEIVELVYKLGVNYICSDAIALPEQNIMPLSKKILAKIKNLKS